MTAKEKAIEIANKMYNGGVFGKSKEEHLKELENAKRGALIAVNELINETRAKYWYEVKREIKQL
jgi:hypothetical protein